MTDPRCPDAAHGPLWAPWRMEYIRQPKTNACFLCEAAAASDDRACWVVRRRGPVFLVLNRYPYNNGHAMIAPLRHVAGIEDLDEAERLDMMTLAADTVRALRACVCPEGFNVGINQGRIAGAGLDSHLHLHVVPRWSGDTNFMPVIAGTKVIPQSLDDLWRALRGAFEPSAAPGP